MPTDADSGKAADLLARKARQAAAAGKARQQQANWNTKQDARQAAVAQALDGLDAVTGLIDGKEASPEVAAVRLVAAAAIPGPADRPLTTGFAFWPDDGEYYPIAKAILAAAEKRDDAAVLTYLRGLADWTPGERAEVWLRIGQLLDLPPRWPAAADGPPPAPNRPPLPPCPGCGSPPAADDVDDVCPGCGAHYYRANIARLIPLDGGKPIIQYRGGYWERRPPSEVKAAGSKESPGKAAQQETPARALTATPPKRKRRRLPQRSATAGGKPDLGQTADAALRIIRAARGKGLTGKEIVKALTGKGIHITPGYFRRHIVKTLYAAGVANHPARGGYYWP